MQHTNIDWWMMDTYFVGWDEGLDGEERSVVANARWYRPWSRC